MPELPDIEVYLGVLRPRVVGARLERVRIRSPFLIRSISPGIDEVEGLAVTDVSRLGKRIVLSMEGDAHIVIHLMIAGRLRWRDPGARLAGRGDQGAFDFAEGSLVLTEAGSVRRASVHVAGDGDALKKHDPGGLEVLESGVVDLAAVLGQENHTIKRTLTTPRLMSGIGNAYSDEILHAARMSPMKQTRSFSDDEVTRLHEACIGTLTHWTAELQREFDLASGGPGRFPGAGEITAFRKGFAVHGRFGKPCPVCGSPVQRIVYASNETNYCATCQTGGRILSDRSLARLLKDDWPRTIEELEGVDGET